MLIAVKCQNCSNLVNIFLKSNCYKKKNRFNKTGTFNKVNHLFIFLHNLFNKGKTLKKNKKIDGPILFNNINK